MSRYIPHGPLGMGGAPLGNLFDRVPEDVAQATIAAAWQADIRHFDTAPHYGAGLSEHRMGDGLRPFPRDEYTLSTKVGRMLEPAQDVPEHDQGFVGGLPFRRRLDYSAAGARRSIEDSLQRLGLSRIDIVYIHDVSEDWLGAEWKKHFADAMAGAAKALTELRRGRRDPRLGAGREPRRAVPRSAGRWPIPTCSSSPAATRCSTTPPSTACSPPARRGACMS